VSGLLAPMEMRPEVGAAVPARTPGAITKTLSGPRGSHWGSHSFRRILADSALSLNGTTLEPGDPAFSHDFRFTNWWATAGVDVPIGSGGFQLGLGALGHRFRLEQRDHLREEDHEYKVSWTEWVPSLGVRVEMWGVEMGYALRLINRGTAPCDPHSYRSLCRTMPVPYHFTGLRVAPTLPEDLPDFSLTTHQLTVSVPLG